MNKMMITVIAFAAGIGTAKAEPVTIDFDGKASVAAGQAISADVKAPAAASLLAQAARQPAEAEMPARPAPEFTDLQLASMDKAIDGVIKRADGMNNPAFKRNMQWLRNASPEEKFAFVYAAPGSVYKFPKACYSKQNKDLIDDAIDAVTEWVCETVTTVECVFTCTYGEGNSDTAQNCYNDCHDVLVESCHQK